MSQVARPVADEVVSGWWPQPVYAQINDYLYPDDSTLVSSGDDSRGDYFQVDLSFLARPVAGPQVLTVRLRKTSGADYPVEVALVQGGGPAVATRVFQPATELTTYQFTLTDAEAAAIQDYRLLSLVVTAGGTRGCSQCAAAPLQWQFTLSDITNGTGCGNCGALNGTWTLTYSGPPQGTPACFNLCTWDSGGPGLQGNVNYCGDGIGVRWFLSYQDFDGFNGWHLFLTQSCNVNPAGGGFDADYVLNGTFNCLGQNDFTQQPFGSGCNLPDTITLTPV